MSRRTPTLKQNPAWESPSPPPPLTFSLSPSLALSFIRPLLSSRVVAAFHGVPWARGEQYKHTLLRWIRVRNPISPSYSSYSFSFFPLPSFFPLCPGRETGGGIKQAKLLSVLSLFSPFLSSRFVFVNAHTLTHIVFPSECKGDPPIVAFNRQHKGPKQVRVRKRLLGTKDGLIDCKLRNIIFCYFHFS